MFLKIKKIMRQFGRSFQGDRVKISVIVVVDERAKNIANPLALVQGQNLKSIEVICVKIGAPDTAGTAGTAGAAGTENAVMNMAMTAAMNEAKGEFLIRIGSKDQLDEETLSKLWQASNEGEVDVVCCGYKKIDEVGKPLFEISYDNQTYDLSRGNANLFDLIDDCEFSNKLWRKSLFTKNGILFPSSLCFENSPAIWMALSKAKSLKTIDHMGQNRFFRKTSASKSYLESHMVDFFKNHQVFYEFLKQKKLLKKHRAGFEQNFNRKTADEFNKLLNSNLSQDKKMQFAKNFILLKAGFIEMHDKVALKKMKQLKALIKALRV